eukprot:4836896-Prymnesium_polylepis.1
MATRRTRSGGLHAHPAHRKTLTRPPRTPCGPYALRTHRTNPHAPPHSHRAVLTRRTRIVRTTLHAPHPHRALRSHTHLHCSLAWRKRATHTLRCPLSHTLTPCAALSLSLSHPARPAPLRPTHSLSLTLSSRPAQTCATSTLNGPPPPSARPPASTCTALCRLSQCWRVGTGATMSTATSTTERASRRPPPRTCRRCATTRSRRAARRERECGVGRPFFGIATYLRQKHVDNTT